MSSNRIKPKNFAWERATMSHEKPKKIPQGWKEWDAYLGRSTKLERHKKVSLGTERVELIHHTHSNGITFEYRHKVKRKQGGCYVPVQNVHRGTGHRNRVVRCASETKIFNIQK